jgi:hypothetical protein
MSNVRCPTSETAADGTPHTVIGCGSSNVHLSDDGLFDCLDCGLFFDQNQENQHA